MTIELRVELYGTPIGELRGQNWRSADLAFHEEALARWGLNSTILSVAAPLSPRPRRNHAPRRRNVLSELLPEGPMRERLARLAGARPDDAAALLARFGRDVAGAVTVFDPRSPREPPNPDLLSVGDDEIAQLIEQLALGNHPTSGKTSLAGVQPKLVLAKVGEQWCQPVGGAASTHIVKPATAETAVLLAEEEYGHRITAALGLTSTSAQLEQLGGHTCLVIERYDRTPEAARIHQEDFNQALGLAGDEKYGGHARLERVAAVVAQSAPQDLGRLATHLTVAIAMGNLDLHAKNLGLLHPTDGSTRLPPAYDMVPMAHRPGIDGRLAMAVDGEYRLARVTAHHLEREIARWGADPAIVQRTLEDLGRVVEKEIPTGGADNVRPRIMACVDRLASGREIGDAFAEA